MRKIKKVLAGIVSAAMIMSSMTLTAFAAQTTTPATIDTTKTGSLTIHKYEYNGTDGVTGTGESTDTVPEDAVELAGVTFKITKVAELQDYYGTDANALPTLEAAKIMAEGKTSESKTTGADGTAVFDDLSLGLYLVQEVSAPAQITGKVQDFLVSIPMTTTDGDEWLYDVHVFPKNSSTYAGVTLQKQGQIGDGTPSALQGATFVLQVKEGNTWTTVTKNNKGAAIGTEGTLTTDGNGKITVSDLAPGDYRFVETGVPNDTGYIMDGTDVKEFTITDEGKVTIKGEEVDTTNTPISVINYKPDVEKEVKDRTDGTWGNDSDYSAGSTVPYRVTVDVPENVAKLKKFTVSDEMDNQTYKDGTLRIYSDANLTTEILSEIYSVDTTGTPAWSIAFNNNGNSLLSGYAGKSIYIYFETTLGANAVTTNVGNPNTVKLEYSNKILPETNDDGNPNNPGNPSDNSITDQAVVYTFKIAVEKVDAANNNPLSGVKFDLYRKTSNESTNPVPVAGLPTGAYEKIGTDYITDAAGKIDVNGLENGEYYLVETETNDGYNLLKAPVKVEIAAVYTTTTATETKTDINGVTTTTTTVTNETFENTGDSGVFKTVIKNSKGFTLPTTGGMGTLMFSVIGAILMIGAAIVLFRSSKRKTA